MEKFSDFTRNKININHHQLNSELLAISENEKQVGSLIMCYAGDVANIFSVAVLDKHRGKGYGKKLVEGAINRAKELGYKMVELNTETDNTVANSLYEGLGFTLTGLKDDFNNYQLFI